MAINFLALGVTGYFFEQLYGNQNIPAGVSTIPNVAIPGIDHMTYLGPAIGDLNLLIWVGIVFVPLSYVILFKTPIGLRVRACGEHPRAADTVGINVYAVRYAAVIVSGMLAALGGAFLSIGYGGGSFTENMTEGRGFIALAAMIFGNWRPFGAWGARAPLRLLDRARLPAAGLLELGSDTLPGAPLRAHADRGRGRHRSARFRRKPTASHMSSSRRRRHRRDPARPPRRRRDPGRSRVAWLLPSLDLLPALVVSVPAAFVLSLLAISAARRARFKVDAKRRRIGERTARVGRLFAWAGLYLALVGGLALGFYGVIRSQS